MDLRIHSRPPYPNMPDPNAVRHADTTPSPIAPRLQSETHASQAAPPRDVTPEEWAWIQHHFPPSEKVALRLYGPNRALQTLRPGGLGTQLDVKG